VAFSKREFSKIGGFEERFVTGAVRILSWGSGFLMMASI